MRLIEDAGCVSYINEGKQSLTVETDLGALRIQKATLKHDCQIHASTTKTVLAASAIKSAVPSQYLVSSEACSVPPELLESVIQRFVRAES